MFFNFQGADPDISNALGQRAEDVASVSGFFELLVSKKKLHLEIYVIFQNCQFTSKLIVSFTLKKFVSLGDFL